ncbi:enolase-phosphatase E1-like [Linepithema humile]|uniref:enolase-phosphatase E1-like n=1 Tax=Linepithema humile TaxID=83485 RepID=UPI0006231F6D|nr:PREDICTED: myb-like protein X [Linepithema humile]
MSRQYCFLCASDEGVFLVVTPDNFNIFNNQLETCLTTKVNECTELSNNICYKCAYELDQCTKFVEKYKKSHEIAQPKVKPSEPYCYLCFEFVESDRIFDITKDNRAIFHPLQKVRNIFNEDLSKKDSYSRLVCLTCRYNLDVLYDLKRVYHETVINLKALINKEIDYTSFPKVHTDVINRKTTVTTFPDITFYGSVNSDTESIEDMARNRKSRVKTRNNAKKLQIDMKTKSRICNHCHNIVANGIDMYRFHRTGLTVCKGCWLTIDPTKGRGKKQLRKTQDSFVETKLCSVFLTDVLSEESHKSEKVYRVEKDKDGNKFFIVSDESSLEEDKSSENSRLSISPKLENRVVNGDAQQGKKRRIDTVKSDVESTPTKVTRSNQKRTNVNETKSTKLFTDAEEKSIIHSTQQRHKRTRSTNDVSSDSDVPLTTAIKTRKLNNHRRLQSSSVDSVDNQERKKLRSILKGITTNVRIELSDQSSNEGSMTPRRKTRNVPNSSNTKEVKKEICTRTRSSSISSMEISPSEFKSPKVVVLSEIKAEYICDECNKEFDTKLSREEHRLTHLKQAVLKLERIIVPSEKKQQEMEVDSQEDKISEEPVACSSRTISIDKNADDLSEEIAINVEDDTDDEEIFSVRKSESAQKKIVMNDKNDNETDKLDATEGKSSIEEESAKVINEEVITKESQQCEESAIVLDEAITSVEIQDDHQDAKEKNTETSINKDIDTSKDTDIESQEAILTTVKNQKNLNAEENSDAEVENNTEESVIEREKSVDRCDNDKKDVHKDTTVDTTVESTILSTCNTVEDNENYNENCKNDLKDSEIDEETADVETRQCNSANKSLKKSKKLEEEQNTISDVTDKTEILNNERNLEDVITIDESEIETLEEQQNKTDEQSMETETIIDLDADNDKDNLSFLNYEKLDKAEGDKEEDNVAVILADSNNDTVKSKETTEEITTNNSNMENALDDIELIENNITSNNCERQELSNDVNNSSTDAANEILKEVFEFAANEVQNREDSNSAKYLENTELETVENVSREACNDADMPSLDPISVMEIDDNDITLN